MVQSIAVALLITGLVLPATAQHGGGHGGSAGHAGAAHAGGGFHSGFSPGARPAPPAYGSQYGGARAGAAPNSRMSVRAGSAFRYGAQPLNYTTVRGGAQPEHRSPYRHPYRRPDRGGVIYEYPYAFGGYAYDYPYGLGYYGDSGYDDSYDDSGSDSAGTTAPYSGPDQYNGFDPQAQDYPSAQPPDWAPQEPYQQAAPDQAPGVAQLEPNAPYRAHYGPPPAVSPAATQPVVTLVFKDRRPNQQIRNYLINGDTLTVWDQRPHEIALDQLDLPATEKLNHDAGVDLYLPSTPR